MTTGVVVCGILLSGDELLRMEELAIRSGSDLVNHSWLQVDKDGTGNVLAGTLIKKRIRHDTYIYVSNFRALEKQSYY